MLCRSVLQRSALFPADERCLQFASTLREAGGFSDSQFSKRLCDAWLDPSVPPFGLCETLEETSLWRASGLGDSFFCNPRGDAVPWVSSSQDS